MGQGRSAVPGLARANHRGPYHTLLYPPAYHTSPPGGRSSSIEEWETSAVGGEKKGLGQNIANSSNGSGPGDTYTTPTGG